MANKKYTFIRVYKTTKEMIDTRAKRMNEDLRILGVRRQIPKIRVIDEVAKKLFFISDRDLIRMAGKRRNKLC